MKLKNISTKQEAQSASLAVDLRVTDEKNFVFSRVSVVPPKSLEGELFPNGATEGQDMFEIPSDEKKSDVYRGRDDVIRHGIYAIHIR